MTKKQASKFSSYNRITNFLFAYAASFTGLVRLLKCIVDFKKAFADLKVLLPSATAIKSSPTTITKNKDFNSMIDLIVSLASRAYLFAVDTASETLLSTFQVEISDFKALSEIEQTILAQNVLAALNANSVPLIAGYDIAATELTAASASITLAQEQIAAPSTIISSNKTSTDEIDEAFKVVDATVVLLEKAIYGRFKTGVLAKPSLISNFNSAKKLRGLTNHTALIADIVNIDHEPVANVLVEISFGTETRSATSNISGIAEIEQFIGGTYNVTYSAVGYITQVIPTTFTLGETVDTTIVLLKVM